MGAVNGDGERLVVLALITVHGFHCSSPHPPCRTFFATRKKRTCESALCSLPSLCLRLCE